MRRADRVRSGLALVALAGALVAFAAEARGSDLIVLQAVEAAAEIDEKLEHCLDLAEVGDREYDQQAGPGGGRGPGVRSAGAGRLHERRAPADVGREGVEHGEANTGE
jgi:hypothetical protein